MFGTHDNQKQHPVHCSAVQTRFFYYGNRICVEQYEHEWNMEMEYND